MNLHEYQSKELFKQNGIAVPNGRLVTSADQVEKAIKELKGNKVVAKVQVHAGGRGKAGGVVISESPDEIRNFVEKFVGKKLVTYQSGPDGKPVNSVWIEEASDIAAEFYFGIVLDRSKRCLTAMASSEGGVEIEKVANATPEKIIMQEIDPLCGLMPFQARNMAFKIGLIDKQVNQFVSIATKLANLYVEKDISLLEVNPLLLTKDGTLLCADGKVGIDDGALFRHQELKAYYDPSQEDEKERIANEQELNYISLDGTIGCMVNGAGLAMATMDLIKICGGDPANFLDVGGTASAERVAAAFKLIISDKKVKSILINIFGGIVKCDLIAEGIISAMKEVNVTIPVVVRLEGTNAAEGLAILSKSSLKIEVADNLENAAKQAVTSVERNS